MLIVTRAPGEKVMLGDDIVVEVIGVSGNIVRLGFQAPRELPVYREEIYNAVRDENLAAVDAAPASLPTPK